MAASGESETKADAAKKIRLAARRGDIYWQRAEHIRLACTLAETWRAVRTGKLKWIAKHDAGSPAEEWLFDLKSDPGGKEGVKAQRSADVTRLKALLAEWEQEVKVEY